MFPCTVSALTPSPAFLFRARSLAEALFASPSGPPPAERLDRATEAFAQVVMHGGVRARFLFTVALYAVGWLSPLLIGKVPSAWSLPLQDRVRAVGAMEATGLLAAPVMLCKAILCIVYYEEPGAAEEIGHVGVGFWEKPPAAGAGGEA